MSLLAVPVSYGELLDKISILEIKAERIADAAKRANVRDELDLLNATRSRTRPPPSTSRPSARR